MRCLVTGVAGFAGRHLAALLLERGNEVHGMLHSAGRATELSELTDRHPAFATRLHVGDVTDAPSVDRVVATVQPDGIFHLAGVTSVPASVADPAATLRINTLGGLHVFAAVRRHVPRCRVLVVGSSEAYGAVRPEDLPITEACALRPVSPYGASKAALDVLAHQWAYGEGLEIVRVRPFNHTGPGQRGDFVCPDFARQLVAISRGERPPVLSVGDLAAVRDFSDVRDVVAAYVAVWERGTSGAAYNVCSGVGRTIASIVETLSELVGVQVRTEPAAERRRRVSPAALVGSADALRAATGWSPRIAWRDTLSDVVADARR
jgi:GDP-4-dehydro-6-deoxy-D-mannose reductase